MISLALTDHGIQEIGIAVTNMIMDRKEHKQAELRIHLGFLCERVTLLRLVFL